MSQIIQMYIVYVLQVIITAGLINVWLVRFNKPTQYRGGGAGNMAEEFTAYGLPKWFMYIIGASKIGISILMIVGFWVPVVVYPASLFLVLLMIGAVSMHIKVKDPFIRALPALLMFIMALINVVLIKFI